MKTVPQQDAPKHGPWKRLLGFCDSCAQIIDPRRKARERRDEIKESSAKQGGSRI